MSFDWPQTHTDPRDISPCGLRRGKTVIASRKGNISTPGKSNQRFWKNTCFLALARRKAEVWNYCPEG